MTEGDAKSILCFGEILWDSLPRGLFPGGAPMNVAYHLQQLGAHALPVTAVGRDQLGEELLRRLNAWGADTSAVHVHPTKPTGLARVTLTRGGQTFEIVEDAAWDWIELSAAALERAARCAAVVFGSLAQRGEHNRRQLPTLLQHCPAALKVFDVNLRPPYDSPELVWRLAETADLVKLNEVEARQLLRQDYSVDQLESAARRLAGKTRCSRICITAGAAGAGLLADSQWHWAGSRPIEVKDTVGAGDAFLAALVHGLLRGDRGAEEILPFACRLAEFVASNEGATPAYRVGPSGEIGAICY